MLCIESGLKGKSFLLAMDELKNKIFIAIMFKEAHRKKRDEKKNHTNQQELEISMVRNRFSANLPRIPKQKRN